MTIYAIVKLKPNVTVSVDRHYESSDKIGIDLEWIAKKIGAGFYLTRPGYGVLCGGAYGNGSAYVRHSESFEMLTPWCLLDSPLLSRCRDWVKR